MIGNLRKVARRHGKPLVLSLVYELFIRSYRNRFIRKILNPLFAYHEPKGYFFLVGCYNAGTTVVKNVVAAHPDVCTAPIEGDVLTEGLSNFEEGGWPRAMYGNAFRIIRHRKGGELDKEKILSGWKPWLKKDKYFFEKSISQSIRVKLLREAFKGSRFICVAREPQAVVKGILQRSQPSDIAEKILGRDTYPTHFLYKQWAFIYGLILKDAKVSDTTFCQYESFINNPVETTEALFRFLGLREVAVSFHDNTLVIGDEQVKIRPSSKEYKHIPDVRLWAEDEVKNIEEVYGSDR